MIRNAQCDDVREELMDCELPLLPMEVRAAFINQCYRLHTASHKPVSTPRNIIPTTLPTLRIIYGVPRWLPTWWDSKIRSKIAMYFFAIVFEIRVG